MKKIELDLNLAARGFETISNDTHVFYNIKTGEFGSYIDFMEEADTEAKKFKGKAWIAAPSQYDIDEYHIMVSFVETVSDSHKNELLCVALEGAGAFRRFKDTLYRVDLTDEWYAFKYKAHIEIARKWCEENGIKYSDNTKN